VTLWHLSNRGDVRAQRLADAHYSRQTAGARQFMPPGKTLVLVIPSRGGRIQALWTISYQRYPMDAFDCWRNSHFRKEQDCNVRASVLIAEARQVCVFMWRDIPKDGLHTFVDPTKVQGVKVRGETVYGFSYMKAGFELHSENTKQHGLLRWVLSADKLRKIAPLAPVGYAEQLRLAM